MKRSKSLNTALKKEFDKGGKKRKMPQSTKSKDKLEINSKDEGKDQNNSEEDKKQNYSNITFVMKRFKSKPNPLQRQLQHLARVKKWAEKNECQDCCQMLHSCLHAATKVKLNA